VASPVLVRPGAHGVWRSHRLCDQLGAVRSRWARRCTCRSWTACSERWSDRQTGLARSVARTCAPLQWRSSMRSGSLSEHLGAHGYGTGLGSATAVGGRASDCDRCPRGGLGGWRCCERGDISGSSYIGDARSCGSAWTDRRPWTGGSRWRPGVARGARATGRPWSARAARPARCVRRHRHQRSAADRLLIPEPQIPPRPERNRQRHGCLPSGYLLIRSSSMNRMALRAWATRSMVARKLRQTMRVFLRTVPRSRHASPTPPFR
jgi:hypothetical protein